MVKEISKIRLLAAVGLLILGSLFALDWRRKQGVIDAAYQDLVQVKDDVQELVDLGFDSRDEALLLLQKRETRMHAMITQLKRDWFVASKTANAMSGQDQLDQLIALHKKMMRSCVRDMRDYGKLGRQKGEAEFQFAHDSLVRLAISLDDLEQRRTDAYQYGQKMHRMVAINQQIINQYKKTLHDFRSHEIVLNNEQVVLIKKNITQHLRTIDALQNLVV